MISVIIRSKNEAFWISRCLHALANQRVTEIEAILVDNESNDGTPVIAQNMGARLVKIRDEDFSFGRAINIGFEAASYENVAILSAHCIPMDDLWADYMIAALHSREAVAGVYGRQEPMPDSNPFDKRDLWLTFREQRLYQVSDPFFHNANSMISKEIWRSYPFDEEINGQEDREWGQRVVGAGFGLVYEPYARVYHQHGIHQGRNEDRAERVVRVIEYLNDRSKSN